MRQELILEVAVEILNRFCQFIKWDLTNLTLPTLRICYINRESKKIPHYFILLVSQKESRFLPAVLEEISSEMFHNS